MDISSKVKELIKEPIENLGYTLSDVMYVHEDSTYYLRVIIDKEGFIDVEDCVKVTHLIDPMLDNIDYISDSYILDVCSYEKGSGFDEKE